MYLLFVFQPIKFNQCHVKTSYFFDHLIRSCCYCYSIVFALHYCYDLTGFKHETFEKKHCSDFTFMNQQIAQSNKPPYLAISLSIFTENNEAYVSQEDDHLTHLLKVKPEDPSGAFFLANLLCL